MSRKRVSPEKRRSNNRVSQKIEVLRHEGTPQLQSEAMAISMERAGRLRKGGVYVHSRSRRARRLRRTLARSKRSSRR